jgi:ABC-type transporter Mla subunit MlaD
MAAVNLASNLETTATQFHQASAQTQLVILYYIAKRIHQTSQMATPSAFFSQKVQEVLKQIQQLPKGDRHEALEEILHGVPTRLTEAYEGLDANMRMAFWYRLANSRRGDALLPSSYYLRNSQEQETLLSDLDSRDSNELVTFMRAAVEA